jgi:hypothetical protein
MSVFAVSKMPSVRKDPVRTPPQTPPSPYVGILFVRFYAESKRVTPDVTALFVT